ncbi:MAG TPA: 7-carboxy-7-deazaguanine synthase [Candidatus Marinimicrobia bacterium]|jgi:7-carboxy-7-deazaguanine synthase (Cx14CxxC type)|nr:7-carboxy-7-deazaguanine synthase [Candidatus Neomarinimicrobiota bacterium]HIB29836.1 7-carboxy-7-deazaguanine synthase [Candidatus Neomarinimicrobiota bacterium]
MSYSIKTFYYTLQGEGLLTGRPAVFCRFSGCNLWSGLEKDRKNAICNFCDTEFVGTDGLNGGKYPTAESVAEKAHSLWPAGMEGIPYVVCTGGEPLLQLDSKLIHSFHENGFEIGIETNGTLPVPDELDWVCVSPKSGAVLIVEKGDELKIVYPQNGLDPSDYEGLNFDHFSLQPMDGLNIQQTTHETLDYCMNHPQWNLSLQIHKLLNIP